MILLGFHCDPSTYRIFNGTELEVRALKALVAGDEATGSIVGQHNEDAVMRRKILMERWAIDCPCELCLKLLPLGLPEGLLKDHVFEILSQVSHFRFHWSFFLNTWGAHRGEVAPRVGASTLSLNISHSKR
jgi:hypothetical protein